MTLFKIMELTVERASFSDIRKVTNSCNEKNINWKKGKKRTLHMILMQRKLCIYVNKVAQGLEFPPLPL